MDKLKQFKQELKALLAKYDASIEFGVDDDTDFDSIYGDGIDIVVGDQREIFEGCWELTADELGGDE